MPLEKHILDKIRELYSEIDVAVEKVRENFPEEVRCGKGCSDCYHAVFDVSLAEALYIRDRFFLLDRKKRRSATRLAEKALKAWDKMLGTGADLSKARIRCPLLTDKDFCLCYEARPVNCRTYGVTTVIGGKGHVCGLSGFKKRQMYPTINLDLIQKQLLKISMAAEGEIKGRLRMPVSEIITGRDLSFSEVSEKMYETKVF